MARTKHGVGLTGLLADIARKQPTCLLAQGLKAAPQQEDRERKGPPPGQSLAQGIVDTLKAMPGAMEHLRYSVEGLMLLEHPEQNRVLLLAQCVREACTAYGLPIPQGCDWGYAVRLLYPAGAGGNWWVEANLEAQERGLNPHYRWVREEPLLTEDEEWLAQVLLAAFRGDGAPLLALVDAVAERIWSPYAAPRYTAYDFSDIVTY